MKRRELIEELIYFNSTIPENASMYHRIDMILYRAERLGLKYKWDDENICERCGRSSATTCNDMLLCDVCQLDLFESEMDWRENEELD